LRRENLVAHPQRGELLKVTAAGTCLRGARVSSPAEKAHASRLTQQFPNRSTFHSQSRRQDACLTRCYAVFDRDLKNHVRVVRPENIALETEEAKLSSNIKADRRTDGEVSREERRWLQMGRYLENLSPPAAGGGGKLGAAAGCRTWRVRRDFRRANQAAGQIAKNAGFDNYATTPFPKGSV